MVVAGLQGDRVPDVENGGDERCDDERPVQRLRTGGDEPDRDRGEQDRGEPVVGEDERIALAGDGLRREVPYGVGDRGDEHQGEDRRRHSLMTTVFVCVYSSRASIDFSRPYPDFLNPPKGSSTPPPAP